MESDSAEFHLEHGSRGSACRALEGMDAVVASVSGYHGRERFKLIKLITQTGAHYVGTMTRSTTHLVCWELEGKKYNLARSFGIKIVSHLWFLDCLKKGRRISEHPYVMQSGREAGPILWDTPGEHIPAKRKGEVPEDCNYHNKSMLRDLSNTFDGACNQVNGSSLSEKGISCYGLLGKEHDSSLYDLIENTCVDRRSRKLRRKNKTDFSSHALPESSHRAETSYPQEINNCDSIYIESLQGENEHFETNQTIEEFEDIVQLNSSSNYHSCHIETTISSNKSSSRDQREEIDVSPSSNPFRSPSELSCVICWTDFSSTRGVLACGHRFCYSCIKGWADCMASKRKVSTCPLCKSSFSSITKVDSAVSSDQKIYSQTIPSSSEDHFCYPLIDQDSFVHFQDGLDDMVCHECQSREPEEQLQCCHLCRNRWVHSCCLDPPILPWTCVHCRDLRVLYQLFRC